LTREQKSKLRDIIEALILSYTKNREKIENSQGTYIFNININENKVKSEVNLDPELLLKKVKILEEQKKEAKQIIGFYENEIENLKREQKELKKQLDNYSLKIKTLQDKITKIKSYLKWIEDDPKIIRNILMNIKEILGVS